MTQFNQPKNTVKKEPTPQNGSLKNPGYAHKDSRKDGKVMTNADLLNRDAKSSNHHNTKDAKPSDNKARPSESNGKRNAI
jgi:hypothetical protein